MRFGADFTALTERFSPDLQLPILLGVSGGSDSLALLWLTHRWALETGRALHILTVDHKLRPEAAKEAANVSHLCQELGHPHSTLVWDTPKPAQNAARGARHALLAQSASSLGARIILLGHTFDDVVETALIRRRRGNRSAAVAGPVLASPSPIWPEGRGQTLLRPLVHTSRQELQNLLVQQGLKWVTDPSNSDPAYERIRIRQTLKRHPTLQGLAAHQVRCLQPERQAEEARIGQVLAHATSISVSHAGLIEVSEAASSPEIVSLLARFASGQTGASRLAAAVQMLATLKVPGQRQTLGGAWFQKTKTGLVIGRDPGKAHLEQAGRVWDGRYLKSNTDTPTLQADMPFLLRQSAPPDQNWREIISDRLSHQALCYQTPFVNPVQR